MAKTASAGTPRSIRWAPSSTPTSSPRSIRHPPSASGSGTATAHRSASGSLARTMSACRSRAAASAASMAPGSSGLGKATVGKSGSGSPCETTTYGASKPALTRAATSASRPDAVQRRVHDGQVTRGVGRRHGRDGVQVGLQWFVVEGDPAVVGQRHVRGAGDGGDLGGDVRIGRWHDLAAVAEVDLVSVVLRRVVARRDHDAGVAAEVPDRERQHRGRQPMREHDCTPAGRGHHGRGVPREDVGVVPGVVPDDDARRAALRPQVGREPGGGPDHDRRGSSGAARRPARRAARRCRTPAAR